LDIQPVINKIKKAEYRYSIHAIVKSIERKIKEQEVVEAILNGEIIEKYYDDKYSPSCLIYGMTKEGRHIHVQCSIPPEVVIITVYEPDPCKWHTHKIRRK